MWIAAILSLMAIVLAGVLDFAGVMTLEQTKLVALVATAVWFAVATPWLGRADEDT